MNIVINAGPRYATTPCSSSLSHDQLVALHSGYGVDLMINGRKHLVTYDGKYYRCGVMRSKTLDGLTSFVSKVVR